MTKEYIQDNLLTVQGKLNNRAIMKLKPTESFEELYTIYTGKEKIICPDCSSEHKFLGFSKGYREKCSKKSCKSVSDRRKATCIERYGVDTYINLPKIQEKALKKASSKESREKVKKTVQDRYGVDNISHIPEVKIKKQETCLKNYGVRYIQQSDEYTPYKVKKFTMPSGEVRNIQGYEDRLLKELLEDFTEKEILSERKDIPEFWYIGEDNKKHRYFPDAYIPKTNSIYEVKSEYTASQNKKRNKLKFQSVKDAGYNFILKIY